MYKLLDTLTKNAMAIFSSSLFDKNVIEEIVNPFIEYIDDNVLDIYDIDNTIFIFNNGIMLAMTPNILDAVIDYKESANINDNDYNTLLIFAELFTERIKIHMKLINN